MTRLRTTLSQYPFAILLATLSLMLGLSPVISLFGEFSALFEGLRALLPLSLLVVSASAFALWQRRHHHALHLLAAIFVAIFLALGGFITHRSFAVVQLSTQIVFLLYVLWSVIRVVFSTRDVTADILCGSVCVYLLTGVVAGLVFVLIEISFPGSYLITGPEGAAGSDQVLIHDPGWLLYFSFVTLTTVGYGDIVPASNIARSAAVVVAVAGQILLMVMIARLVGLHVVQAAAPPES
ncbi:MAG: ion channel [Terrimicrobiaceae bacterium]|nr:ion channel [Terrimicrobiaceae bacterium]